VTPQPPKLSTGKFWARTPDEFLKINKVWPTSAERREMKNPQRKPADILLILLKRKKVIHLA